MLETLLVLVAIGIASAITISKFRNTQNRMAAENFASEARSRIQSARFEAIKRNRNVAVFFDGGTESLRTIVKDPDNSGCDLDAGDIELANSSVAIPDGVELDRTVFLQGSFISQGGIVWRPKGLTGRCSNFNSQGFNTLKVRFDSSFTDIADFDIAISSAGRVRLTQI